MGPTNVFDRDKRITPVVLRFFFIGFLSEFVFERHGIEEFRFFELHAFQGITSFKTAYV